MQGIVVEQDANNFLRFEFNSTGPDTRVLVANYSNSQKDTYIYDWFVRGQTGVVPAPMYMRVQRNDNRWILYTSVNGSVWTPYLTFPLNMVVNKIGIYAANATGATSPAFTGQFDYFFNRAAPIQPEDVTLALNKKINLPLIVK